MADSTDDALRQILASCQVQETFSDAILEQGWTVDHLAMMDFENDISEVLGAAACHFDHDCSKSWMFCTTCEEVCSLACLCPHGSQSHQQIAGVRTDSGAYLSRYTAEISSIIGYSFCKMHHWLD